MSTTVQYEKRHLPFYYKILCPSKTQNSLVSDFWFHHILTKPLQSSVSFSPTLYRVTFHMNLLILVYMRQNAVLVIKRTIHQKLSF